MSEQNMDYISFYQKHIKGLRQVSKDEWKGHCPYPENHSNGIDKNPSFSINAKTGQFQCFSCPAKGNLITFCKDHKIPIPYREGNKNQQKQWEKPITIFDYRDENNVLLYQVCRFPDVIETNGKRKKDFRQRRPDGKGKWKWSTKGIRKVPYRLPDLLKINSRQWIFIPEGEKHCDRLYSIGLSATCNVAGAGKWTSDLNPYLKNYKVCILPDNDPQGRRHGQSVAQNLHGIAREIKILNLPGLESKGDIINWLDNGHTKEELFSLSESASPWEPEKIQIEEEEDGEKKPKKSISTRLAEMVLADKEIILFHDEKKFGYIKKGKDIIRIRSKLFKDYLRKLLWKEEERTCGDDALKGAIGLIEAKAVYDFEEYKLYVRTAKRDGKYYYDLGDGRVICIEEGGWKILDETPILFRSFPHQKKQILPQGPGDLRRVLKYINFKRPADLPDDKLSEYELLYLCYLVSCLDPDFSHPIIILTGDQGSGKTTLFHINKPLLDPSHVTTISNPSDFREFIQIADHHYLLFLDNLTHLADWVSDALCRFCTGEGFSKRELYSDDEDFFYFFKRCSGLNGINLVASRADLLDRSLIFSFERIPDDKRIHEKIFYQDFERDLPHILYGLFDAFSKALTYIDDIKLSHKPRMADFTYWGCAIAKALGYTEQDFLNAYYANIKVQNDEAIDASPVAKVIIAYMENKFEITKSSSELYEELKKKAEELKIDTKSKFWPKDPRWLWRRITEVRPNLINEGIRVEQKKVTQNNQITILRSKNDSINSINSRDTQKQIVINGNKHGIIFDYKNDSIDDSIDNTLKNKEPGNTGNNGIIFEPQAEGYKKNKNGFIEGEI